MTVDRVAINKLAVEWAPEIGQDSDALARAIMAAACDGEFDNLAPAHRASVFDEDKLRHFPIEKGRMKFNCEQRDQRLGWRKGRTMDTMIGTGWYFVHKDAVGVFAENRQLPMPVRWTSGVEKPSAVSVSALSEFLLTVADGIKTQPELKQLAETEFGRISRDGIWRPAYRKLPSHLKREPGQTDVALVKSRRG